MTTGGNMDIKCTCGKEFSDLNTYMAHREGHTDERLRAALAPLVSQFQGSQAQSIALQVAGIAAESGKSIDEILALYREAYKKILAPNAGMEVVS